MGFELVQERLIADLSLTAQEYLDSNTGARHYHFAADGSESTFAICFSTYAHSDDGSPHVLEHLTLCGSQNFPVRDPFSNMARRSMATFLNALTYSDMTAYPVASCSESDLLNLMAVYLDATFFPTLHRLDFLQEAWRPEIGEKGQIRANGVVYNEMKEHYSDPHTLFYSGMQKILRAGTPYEHDSGGNPLNILDLTHAGIVEFHKNHYRPSNACFFSHGPIDPALVQKTIEDRVFAKIESARLGKAILPNPFLTPTPAIGGRGVVSIPGGAKENSLCAAWLCTARTLDELDAWSLFSGAALHGSTAPVGMAIEQAGFGRPGVLMFERDLPIPAFYAGMEGLSKRAGVRAEQLILSAVADLAKTPLVRSRLEGGLDEMELYHRQTRGCSDEPHGVSLVLSVAGRAALGFDPIEALDALPRIQALRRAIEDPSFSLAFGRELLRVPDLIASGISGKSFDAKQSKDRRARIEMWNSNAIPADIESARLDQKLLAQRQGTPIDASCLPMTDPSELSELPDPLPDVQFEAGTPTAPATLFCQANTNGIAYFAVRCDLDGIEPETADWLSLALDLMPELGCGDLDYEQADTLRNALGLHIDADIEAYPCFDGTLRLQAVLSSNAVERSASDCAKTVLQVLLGARFDEHERVAYLLENMADSLAQDIASIGSDLCRADSLCSSESAYGRWISRSEGAHSLDFAYRAAGMAQHSDTLLEACAKLASAWKWLVSRSCTLEFIGETPCAQEVFAYARAVLGPHPGPSDFFRFTPAAPLQAKPRGIRLALAGPGDSRHCRMVFSTPGRDDKDCGPLMVLAELLTHTQLHRRIREEGGAYGGGARHNPEAGAFSLSSYRDPRLDDTYKDFRASIVEIANGSFSEQNLKEAILCAAKAFEASSNPVEMAQSAISFLACGVDEKQRSTLRLSILKCSREDILHCCKAYLSCEPAALACYCPSDSWSEADKLGFERVGLESKAGL